MTGAEIIGACREATLMAFRETGHLLFRESHLEKALKNVLPLLNDHTVMQEYLLFQHLTDAQNF